VNILAAKSDFVVDEPISSKQLSAVQQSLSAANQKWLCSVDAYIISSSLKMLYLNAMHL